MEGAGAVGGWAEGSRMTKVGNDAALSRRHLLGSALAGGGATLVWPLRGWAQDVATPVASPVAVPEITYDIPVTYPRPGTRTASLGTEITFRGVDPEQLRTVEVYGERSGFHPGIVVPHSDGKGASFRPDHEFHRGEEVTVRAGFEILDADDGDFRFITARPRNLEASAQRETEAPEDEVLSFRSRPDLKPPLIGVTTYEGELAPGYIFLSPKRGAGRNSAVILDNNGQPVWHFPVERDVEQLFDFRVQQYMGEPVLTWWQGIVTREHSFGHWVLLNSAYEQVAAFNVGNGFAGGDLHELVLTPEGTGLINIYNSIGWDISAVGGPEDGSVIDSVVQEIDIATGCVLYEWHSMDHVALEESYIEYEEDENAPDFDNFHINSVNRDLDGHYLVNARNTWAFYKVDRVTGEVIWRLGGKQSDFELGEGAQPAWQHDVQRQPDGTITLYDNGDESLHGVSRGLVLELDEEAMTAEVLREYRHPDETFASSQGNMQTLPNGNVFIGWGSEPLASEFSAEGEVLLDAKLPPEKQSYRGYRFEWVGRPTDAPAIAAERSDANNVVVWASWNGATEVAVWRLLAGPSADALEPVGEPAERTGFETEISAATDAAFVAVAALGADGVELRRSEAIEIAS